MITRRSRSFLPALFGAAAMFAPGCNPLALLGVGSLTGLPGDVTSTVPADFTGKASVSFSNVSPGLTLGNASDVTDFPWAVSVKDGKMSHVAGGTIEKGDSTTTFALVMTGELKAGREFSLNTASSKDVGWAGLSVTVTTGTSQTAIVSTDGKVKIDSVEGTLLKYADAAKVKFSVAGAKCDVTAAIGTSAATGSATLAMTGEAAARRVSL